MGSINPETLTSGHNEKIKDEMKKLREYIHSTLDDLKEEILAEESVAYLLGVRDSISKILRYCDSHEIKTEFSYMKPKEIPGTGDAIYTKPKNVDLKGIFCLNLLENTVKFESFRLSNPGYKISKRQFKEIAGDM